jgi:hypothetical protein
MAVVGGQLGTVALTIDRWVHAQDTKGFNQGRRFESVEDTLNAITEQIEKTNERWSRELSRMQARIGQQELELARLKAIDEERRRRHDD